MVSGQEGVSRTRSRRKLTACPKICKGGGASSRSLFLVAGYVYVRFLKSYSSGGENATIGFEIHIFECRERPSVSGP